MARTNSYTKEKVQRFCDEVAGGMTIQSICSKYDDMPTPATIAKWLSRYQEFFEMYMKAKAIATELQASQMIDIADNADNSNATDVHKRRLQIDTRKWLAMKLLPRIYGEHTANVFISGDTKIAIDDSILQAITLDIQKKYSHDAIESIAVPEKEVKSIPYTPLHDDKSLELQEKSGDDEG